MKNPILLLGIFLLILINSCEKDDNTQPFVENILIAKLCEINEVSQFCELLPNQEGLRLVAIPIKQKRMNCDSVSTFFAFTNAALDSFLSQNPQWNTIDDIPPDSADLIVQHHIMKEIRIIIDTTIVLQECDEEPIAGAAIPYEMCFGECVFAVNQDTDFRILSIQTNRFSNTLSSPDILNDYGAIYVINQVLGPF